MDKQFSEKFVELEDWIDKNPLSYDLLDIKNQKIFHKIIGWSQKSWFLKVATAPFVILAERKTNFLRKIFNVKKQEFAQSQTLIARAFFAQYKNTGSQEYLKKGIEKLDWLIKNRSPKSDHYGWGQPYDWYSRMLIPAHTPRATVSTQVANTFLDAFEITNEQKYLDIAIDICHLFINDFNWDEDEDGHICFSYTTCDHYHIHNANMLVSSVLIRTWEHSKNEKFKDFGLRSMNFTIKYQNEDGSWFYWAPPDKVVGKIDNYHTGFVLESLEINRRVLGIEFLFIAQMQLGLKYYIENLFDGPIPKLTNKSKFPIDIQSSAQAIITFAELKDLDSDLERRAKEIADWTIANMYDQKGFFYYRIFKNGKIDKTPYIRWSESWMLRALTFLISE